MYCSASKIARVLCKVLFGGDGGAPDLAQKCVGEEQWDPTDGLRQKRHWLGDYIFTPALDCFTLRR